MPEVGGKSTIRRSPFTVAFIAESVKVFRMEKPVEGEVQTVTLAELFAELMLRPRRQPDPAWYVAEMQRLGEMSLAEVRLLWDEYDGTNSPGGFSEIAIHSELNRRGDGRYCAV